MNRRKMVLIVSLTLALAVGTIPGAAAASPGSGPRLSAPNVSATGPNGPFDGTTAEKRLSADLAAIKAQAAKAGVALPTIPKELRQSVAAAKALRASLSPAQKAELRSLLERNAKALDKTLNGANPTAPTRGKSPQNVRDTAATLARVTANIENGFASILSANQRAVHRRPSGRPWTRRQRLRGGRPTRLLDSSPLDLTATTGRTTRTLPCITSIMAISMPITTM